MIRRLLLLAGALSMLLVPVAVSMPVSAAYNPLGGACTAGKNAGNGGDNAAVCSADGSKNPLTGPNGVIRKASTLLAVIASVTAVILLLLGGFRYITSNGDTQKTTSARNTVVGALVGLAIIAMAQGIVIFVVSKL
jgi:hypothetical protein